MKFRKRKRGSSPTSIFERLESRELASAAPLAPSGTNAANVTPTSADIFFRDNSWNEGGFVLDKWTGSNWQCTNFSTPNITTFHVTGLQPGSTNYFVVGALSSDFTAASWDRFISFNTPQATAPQITLKAQQNAAIIDSFHVETNTKYLPRSDGTTYCNIFASDVVTALGAKLPGNLLANQQQSWLLTTGMQYGWSYLGQGANAGATAQSLANQGFVVVASYYNPTGHGHIAVVRPTANTYSTVYGPQIAMAGFRNFDSTSVLTGFTAGNFPLVEYFAVKV